MSWTEWCSLDIYRECAHPRPDKTPCRECSFRRLAEKEDAQAALSGRQGRYHSQLQEIRGIEQRCAIRSEALIPIRKKEQEEADRLGYRTVSLDPKTGRTCPLISEEEKELNIRLKQMEKEEMYDGK